MNFISFVAVLATCISVSANFRLDSGEKGLFRDRIINGETAKPGQFPFQAGVYDYYDTSDTARLLCGGSIISARWILSAAHCTDRIFNVGLIIVVGTHNSDFKTGQVYAVDRIIHHPEYKGFPLKNDILALSTKTAIQFNKLVQPIPLNKAFIGADIVATVSGFGVNSSSTEDESSYLQLLHMHTLTNEECRTRSDRLSQYSISNGTLCTWAEKSSTCHGDSGGPLAANGKLIGVVSWGNGFGCDLGLPNGFSRVSAHLKWIQQVTGVTAI